MDEREIKPHNYKWIVIICLIIMIVCGLFLTFGPKEEVKTEPKKISTISKELTKNQVVGYLNITNISLSSKNNSAIFTAKVNNLTSNILEIKSLNIIIKDKDENVLASLTGYFGGSIGPEESKGVVAETNTNLNKASKIEFEINE